MTSPPTVFVVDDDDAVRAGLTRVLRSAGMTVESFTSGETFLARAPFTGEACLILDLRMPGSSGEDVQERLRERGSDLPIIFLSGHGEIPDSVRAIRRGAADFLTKPVDDTVLLAAIAAATASLRAERARLASVEDFRQRVTRLTPREYDVLRFVIAGALNKQIASHLDIAEGTVKIHRGRVMAKLRVESVAELVRRCEAAGIERASV